MAGVAQLLLQDLLYDFGPVHNAVLVQQIAPVFLDSFLDSELDGSIDDHLGKPPRRPKYSCVR